MSPSVLVMWSLLFCAGPAEAGGKRMNVLFMASDDLRYQLGVSGPGVEGPGCSPGVEGSGCTKMVGEHVARSMLRLQGLGVSIVVFTISVVQSISGHAGDRPVGGNVADAAQELRSASGVLSDPNLDPHLTSPRCHQGLGPLLM